MAEQKSDSSTTSESEVSACSSNFDPLKALYSNKAEIPVENAPMYENLSQFEVAQARSNILPVGQGNLVKKREEEKEKKKQDEQKQLEEKNKQRFVQYEQAMASTSRPVRTFKNLFTRIKNMDGPLGVLKDCVDQRLRLKVITRKENGIRGVLHGTLVAFDKQWNLALSDVLEVWTRKGIKKRKIPPLGTPVPKGTAAAISPVPTVKETPIGKGLWECTRHVPQLMVRGEHVVLVNVVER